ncbi:MAG: ABC transporter permease [Ignavibacteriota bacterium]|nr:ABC transporter permease [Ignavibacteriota bacterium]
MNYKYFIAKRYLFSKKDSKFISFITYISILGVTLGVATLIIAISILSGFEKEIRDKVAGLVSHIQIHSFKSEGVKDYKDVIKTIKDSIPETTGITAYAQREAVIRFKENVEGIMLKGIIQESDLSSTKSNIKKGEYNVQPIDTIFSRLIIGDKLAEKLNIQIGSKVIVFGIQGIPSPLNTPRIKQFIVTGIYETGLRDYDDILIYTDLKTTQKLFNFGEYVTGIEMNVNDINQVEFAVSKIKQVLGYPFYPRSLFKLYKGLFTWVELQKAPTPIILGLIIIVATFNIVGTLLMLVLEKTQSVGILKSLGASRVDVMKIFIFDGLIIGAIGIIIGNIFGLGVSLVEQKYKFFSLPEFYYMKNVPILIVPEYVVLISVITFALVFFATLIPSYLASKFDPVKSLRFH